MTNKTITVPARAASAIAADEVAGAMFQRVKLAFGGEGVVSDVTSGTPLPVTLVGGGGGSSGGLTDAELRAAPVPVSMSFPTTQQVGGTVTVSNPGLTDTQLRATPIAVSGTFWQATQPVSGTLAISNFPATQPISGTVTANTGLAQPLTDTQLRATPVAVSGTVTANTGLSQPLTDAQLRAAAIPVSLASVPSHPVTGTFWQATQPVSATALPLPTGAATETTLSGINAKLPALSGGRIPVELPAGGGGLTDAELRASAIPVTCADLIPLTDALHHEDTPHVSGDKGQLMFGVRSDSDATTADDGDYTVLKLDEEGRLKVASKPASYAATVGNVTSATSAVPINTERFSNLMIHCTGTFNTVNCTFEGSLDSTNGTDGNWFAVQAIRSNANTIETTTGNLSAAPAYAWELSVNALKYFRVRAIAWTSGTQVWTMIPGTYATEPIPGAQVSATQPVSGTVTGNVGTCAPVLYADTTTVLAAAATYTGTSRDAGTTPAYQRFVARAYASHDGTLRVEDSTDNTTWRTVASIPVAAGATQTIDAMVLARYNRVVYVNGATLQTAFRVTSGYHRI